MLATAGPAAAAGPLDFAPKVDYGTGTFAASVAVGDLDGDGAADLAVANLGDDTVSVLLAAGDGTFADKVDYGTGDGPVSVAVGDLDGDGALDLATANENSGTVSVLLSAGDGTFAEKVDYRVGRSPTKVTSGDLDGDGVLDLVVANFGDNFEDDRVSVLSGAGDGTFAEKVDYATGATPAAVAVGDLDGDGNLELVVAIQGEDPESTAGTVSVLSGPGDGTFNGKVEYGTGIAPAAVAVGDLDGDGVLDLAVANANSATVSVLMGAGDGGFADKVDYDAGAGPFSVAVGDLDGDGAADLAVSNFDDDTVSVLVGAGDGTFADKVDYGTGDEPTSVAAGDLDGDGDLDLATANKDDVANQDDNSTVSVLLNLTDASGPVGSGSGAGRPDLPAAAVVR